MRHAVDGIDKQGALGYLDSSNPRNVPLYERFGFKVREKGQYGESPEIAAMLRQRQESESLEGYTRFISQRILQ